MSEFSRVKKNQDLYKTINQEDKTKIIESSLRDYERRLKITDNKTEDYQPSRYRTSQDFSSEDDTFDKKSLKPLKNQKIFNQKEILRDRDLLEEFIEEVKHYNISRGLRNVQDTQMNILKNLGKAQDKNIKANLSDDFSDDIEEEDQDLTKEIQAIISNLDQDDLDHQEDSFESTLKPLDSDNKELLSHLFEEIGVNKESTGPQIENADFHIEKNGKLQDSKQELIKFDPDPKTSVDYKEARDFKSQELLDLTQTLNLKLNLQEEELEQVSSKVKLLDKILSSLIFILVLLSIFIVLFGVYWVAKERGLI